MRKTILLLAVATLAGLTPLARAADKGETTQVIIIQMEPAPGCASSPGKPCAQASCTNDRLGKWWDWVTYKPCRTGMDYHKPYCCQPPLYAYFLEFCPAGGTGCSSCAATPVTAAKVPVEK